MAEVATTVTSTIAVPREPFYGWLVPGVFSDELDTVLRRTAGVPGVANTSGTTGPWDVPGSYRTVHTTDGHSVREEVTAAHAPDYFAYVVSDFTQPLVRLLVKEARGQWWFTPGSEGTRAQWTYAFEGRAPWAMPFLLPVVKIFWNRYMRAAMRVTKERAEKEVARPIPARAWDFDLTALHGQQGMTDEDRAYRGSRYAEVRAALYSNPYRDGESGEVPGPLPMFRPTIHNAWSGCLPGGRPDQLRQATARSVDSRADLRWGSDGKGFRRILSPNGVCVLGMWEITEETSYSGYFKTGAKGLIIGRYSTDGPETRRGQRRSLSLAGKIYPTTDPQDPDSYVPASFVVQEDLGGMYTDYVNDAELTNEPNVTSYRLRLNALILLRAGLNFRPVDKVADVRQLHEIAELGKLEGEPTKTPRVMLLKPAPGQPRIDGDDLDFRDEIYAHIFKPGDARPSGSIEFDLSVSDTARRFGLAPLRRVKVSAWRRIGRVTFTEAVASYNSDHVIQFHHPGWRDDRDDPSTAIRSGERRVRR
jgi:hypothetical protein